MLSAWWNSQKLHLNVECSFFRMLHFLPWASRLLLRLTPPILTVASLCPPHSPSSSNMQVLLHSSVSAIFIFPFSLLNDTACEPVQHVSSDRQANASLFLQVYSSCHPIRLPHFKSSASISQIPKCMENFHACFYPLQLRLHALGGSDRR